MLLRDDRRLVGWKLKVKHQRLSGMM